jgi:SAM-dependent methyltransferase
MIKKAVKTVIKFLFKPILNRYHLILEKLDKLDKFHERLDIFEHRINVIYEDTVINKQHLKFGVYSSSDGSKLKSSVCRMQDLLDYNNWVKEMGHNLTHPHLPKSDCVMNRKAWEYVFISQALYERGMLSKGKKGLGFAVGKEPLPSLFAKYGCTVVATDIDSSTETGQVWACASQHGGSADDLYKADLCNRDIFDKSVFFRFLDMNAIPDNFTNFDFCWSSCAFEHLGSIQNSKQFIYKMMECLKPGGWAIHTTEYNLSSYNGVIDNLGNAIFGRSDLVEMRNTLIAQGHHVEDFDFRLGDYDEENYIAYVPYERPHFKLSINGYISTSFALVIQKKISRE